MRVIKTSTPRHIAQIRLEQFTKWLQAGGAKILDPTNPYEVLRYRTTEKTGETTHVIYRKASGAITWTGSSYDHYRAYQTGYGLALGVPEENRVKRPVGVRRSKIEQALLNRDGHCCWYCGEFLNGDSSIEHLLARSVGGGNEMANLVLAHKECNSMAANKPLGEKILLREELHRQKKEEVPF